MNELLWQNTVDRTWKVSVVRTSERLGLLEISRLSDGSKIYSEVVSLAYGAVFGPDYDDVFQWEQIALKVIDTQPKE